LSRVEFIAENGGGREAEEGEAEMTEDKKTDLATALQAAFDAMTPKPKPEVAKLLTKVTLGHRFPAEIIQRSAKLEAILP
jgi:hypothetical protein